MSYELVDLASGRHWSFEDVHEARASAEQCDLQAWDIVSSAGYLVDSKRPQPLGPRVEVRKHYASIISALDALPIDEALNLICVWAKEHGDFVPGDLSELLDRNEPDYWVYP